MQGKARWEVGSGKCKVSELEEGEKRRKTGGPSALITFIRSSLHSFTTFIHQGASVHSKGR